MLVDNDFLDMFKYQHNTFSIISLNVTNLSSRDEHIELSTLNTLTRIFLFGNCQGNYTFEYLNFI